MRALNAVERSTYIARVPGFLDTLRRGFYKSAPLWLAVGVWLGGASAFAEKEGNGAQLPDGAVRVGENRYRAKEDFDATLKYYKFVYPVGTFPRKTIVNQPGVKAVHIENPSGRGFEGLNIYQANDEVRIYVVPVGSVAGKKTEPSGRHGKKKK